MNRRQALGIGLGGVALVAAAGVGYSVLTGGSAPPSDDYTFVVLDDSSRTIVAAIAPVMLAGALPSEESAQADAVRGVVRGFDIACAYLPAAVQDELKQLFQLLGMPLARFATAGIASSWSSAKSGDVDAFLTHWRYSPLPLLRSGYQALHQLVLAAWYANPVAWKPIGYPGPPSL